MGVICALNNCATEQIIGWVSFTVVSFQVIAAFYASTVGVIFSMVLIGFSAPELRLYTTSDGINRTETVIFFHAIDAAMERR